MDFVGCYLLALCCFVVDGHTSCGRTIDWSIVVDPGNLLGNPAGHPWPLSAPENHVAFRTNILALVYLVLSTIWIITSLMLIGKQYFIIRYFDGHTKNCDELIKIVLNDNDDNK